MANNLTWQASISCYEGNTSATPGEITTQTFGTNVISKTITIINAEDPDTSTDTLLFSLDNGATYGTIEPGAGEPFDVRRVNVKLKSASASVAYRLRVGV